MREACCCGKAGEVEDRKPVTDHGGAEALECRGCGHPERLLRLPEEARAAALEEARRGDHKGRRSAA